jgi:hypothetical protein
VVATDNSGAACPVEAHTSEVPITQGVTPGTPSITSLSGGVLCNGSADLTITPKETGTYTYQWYKDGVAMSATTQTITVDTPGVTYTATVTNTTGCVSAPATKTIPLEGSTVPVLDWKTTTATASNGDKIFYETTLLAGTATSYEWTQDGTKLSATTSSTTITFPATGTSSIIKVKATNPCGTSAEITKTVVLSPLCPTPTVTAATATTLSTVAGIGVPAKVNVVNYNQESYQWYTNTTAATTGGTAITGATSATVTYTPATTAAAGTVYLYCVVTNGCTPTTPVASPVFTVTVTVNPASLTLGSGTFAGKTCFDINKSNEGANCGTIAARTATMTNFATQNVQPYVFTASATGVKSNLRFVVIDELGAVQSTDADAKAVPGTVANSQVVTLTVTYKTTLSDVGGLIYGRTSDQAVNVKIYAIYFDGSKDVSVPLNVKIQDCACCGAYVAAGVWKNFMCHNLGADQSLDPTKASQGIIGDYYQRGQTKSVSVQGFVSGNTTYGAGWLYSGGVKGVNDPCPSGYRVPTKAEWQGVISNNTFTRDINSTWGAVGTSSPTLTAMAKFGERLYLPAAGRLSSSVSTLFGRNSEGYMFYGDNDLSMFYFATNNAPILMTPMNYVREAYPVRCIEQ